MHHLPKLDIPLIYDWMIPIALFISLEIYLCHLFSGRLYTYNPCMY